MRRPCFKSCVAVFLASISLVGLDTASAKPPLSEFSLVPNLRSSTRIELLLCSETSDVFRKVISSTGLNVKVAKRLTPFDGPMLARGVGLFDGRLNLGLNYSPLLRRPGVTNVSFGLCSGSVRR